MNIKVFDRPGDHPAVRLAGDELKAYLGRMLPRNVAGELSIQAALEERRDEDGPDRFQVRAVPGRVTVTGNRPRSVLLGAYDYLRRLGCRFLGPGREREVVPAVSPDALVMNYRITASFRHRGVCIEGADSRENLLDFIDWLPKVGYNGFFLQFKTPYAFFKRWYLHERNPLRQPEPFSPADVSAWAEEAERELKRRDLLLHQVGHGWTGEALGYETQSWDPDPRPLAEDKRPLAAQLNGVRDLYKGMPADTNLCFHNRDAVDAFAAQVAGYAQAHPHVDYLHVWLADEYNNVCECAGCRATTLSDQYVELLNEIDRRLTAQGLPAKIVFLLYQELLWPPVKARLSNPGRFVLMFAPISRTFEQSYPAVGNLPDIPAYQRNRIELPTSLEENLAFLRGWKKQFAGDSFVYDYPLGRAHYGDLGYIKLARVISGDVKRLRRLGLDGYVSCQELRAGLPNFFPNYVLGRTLLDEHADVNELMGEYFSAAYGPDWPAVADHLFQLSTLSSTDYVNGKGGREDGAMASRMEAVRELCLDFTPALDAHRTLHGWQTPFWAALDYHREYVLKLSRALRHLALGEEENANADWRAFRELICAKEPDFQSWLDVYRVLEVTENYTGFRGDREP